MIANARAKIELSLQTAANSQQEGSSPPVPIPEQVGTPTGRSARPTEARPPPSGSEPRQQPAGEKECEECVPEDASPPVGARDTPLTAAPSGRKGGANKPAPVAFAGVGVQPMNHSERRTEQARSGQGGWDSAWLYPGQVQGGRKDILEKHSVRAVPTFVCPKGKFCKSGTCLHGLDDLDIMTYRTHLVSGHYEGMGHNITELSQELTFVTTPQHPGRLLWRPRREAHGGCLHCSTRAAMQSSSFRRRHPQAACNGR
jgi:hypothetical protein